MAQPFRNVDALAREPENDAPVEELELAGPRARRTAGATELWVPNTAERGREGRGAPSLTPIRSRRVQVLTRESENEMRDMLLLAGVVVAQFAVIVGAII
jgi:hypothetical protein